MANRKSVQAFVNCQLMVTTKPGSDCGSTIEAKARSIPAPSTREASMSSIGMLT